MPRSARKECANDIYNIGLKGHNSQVIFYDNEDREKFLDALLTACDKYEVGLAAYVLMSNHVHLIMHGKLDKLELVFKSVGARFVGWYNNKYGRSGSLWNGRYYSKGVESESQYAQLAAYIFNNPVAAGTAKSPIDYMWSNYRAIVEHLDTNAHKLMSKVTCVDCIIEYTQIYSKEKKQQAKEFELIPKTKIGDVKLINFIKKFSKISDLTNICNLSQHCKQKLLNRLLQLGSNANQISRITGIPRREICNLTLIA